ncbi:hypothetical protein [Streptomyces asiaticus]|uniref:hypothetical protein n=1 Tax=Streptomyces asiaticus TaxID=114695 RepID=UPI003D73FE2C
MAIEPVTGLGSGGALRVPRARVVPLSVPPSSYTAAGAKPPAISVTAIDDPALPEVLAELAATRADEMDADTVNRELSIARKAIGWWQRQGWIGP